MLEVKSPWNLEIIKKLNVTIKMRLKNNKFCTQNSLEKKQIFRKKDRIEVLNNFSKIDNRMLMIWLN